MYKLLTNKVSRTDVSTVRVSAMIIAVIITATSSRLN